MFTHTVKCCPAITIQPLKNMITLLVTMVIHGGNKKKNLNPSTGPFSLPPIALCPQPKKQLTQTAFTLPVHQVWLVQRISPTELMENQRIFLKSLSTRKNVKLRKKSKPVPSRVDLLT